MLFTYSQPFNGHKPRSSTFTHAIFEIFLGSALCNLNAIQNTINRQFTCMITSYSNLFAHSSVRSMHAVETHSLITPILAAHAEAGECVCVCVANSVDDNRFLRTYPRVP